MEHLLNDTLQLSRVGRMVNPPEDVPFGEIVQEALEQTTEQIKSSGVEVSVAEDFPTVHVDRMRIAEVLVNLITNSINYMGEQPRPKIDIGYRTDDRETVFFVRDNGIGINKSQHEKVKMKGDLRYIENGTAKMEHLLNDTLQLSRVGRMVNPPEDVPFGEIVQEALEQTTEQIKSSGVEVSVAEDFPTVHVDRMRIAEVLVNLITNSINYMGEQPRPKIDIGYRTDDRETVFFVRDNGIGINKSQHEKVFELFYTIASPAPVPLPLLSTV